MKKLRRIYVGLIMAFLYAPIVLLVLYSFNNSKSRATWGGFTLKWYKELFADKDLIQRSGLETPPLIQIRDKLGMPDTIMTVEELTEEIRRRAEL